jgi:hypothetical protein
LYRVHSKWARLEREDKGGTKYVFIVFTAVQHVKHNIHDEGGENDSTMRVKLNCETRKTARGGQSTGKSKQTGDEIEVMRRVGDNTRGPGTIDDIE